jgi:hypothetical protein
MPASENILPPWAKGDSGGFVDNTPAFTKIPIYIPSSRLCYRTSANRQQSTRFALALFHCFDFCQPPTMAFLTGKVSR